MLVYDIAWSFTIFNITSSFVLTFLLLFNIHNIFCNVYIYFYFFSIRGEFKFDKFRGKGEITYTSGAIYKDDFENGEIGSFILYVLCIHYYGFA